MSFEDFCPQCSKVSLVSDQMHKHADMKILCKDRLFKVHREIVCKQSLYLKEAFCRQLEESTAKPVMLPDVDPEILRGVMDFFYTGDYKTDGSFRPLVGFDGDKHMVFNIQNCSKEDTAAQDIRKVAYYHIDILNAARKLQIRSLAFLAAKKFDAWAIENWNSSDFFEVADEVLTLRLPNEFTLQKIVLEILQTKVDEMIEQDRFKQLLKKHGSLGSYLVVTLEDKRRSVNSSLDGDQEVLKAYRNEPKSKKFCFLCFAHISLQNPV